MATLEINFETWVDSRGYECLPPKDERDPFLSKVGYQPKGGAFTKIRPLEFHPTLYKQFADIPDDPDTYIDFMNKFGPITYMHSPEAGHHDEEWGWDHEGLLYVAEYKTRMQWLIEDWQAGSREALISNFTSTVTADLAFRPNGSTVLRFTPPNLYCAMLIQLGQAIASDRALRSCDWCGSWFEIGAQSKRSSARFCSDQCRTRFHNDRRLKGGKL